MIASNSTLMDDGAAYLMNIDGPDRAVRASAFRPGESGSEAASRASDGSRWMPKTSAVTQNRPMVVT